MYNCTVFWDLIETERRHVFTYDDIMVDYTLKAYKYVFAPDNLNSDQMELQFQSHFKQGYELTKYTDYLRKSLNHEPLPVISSTFKQIVQQKFDRQKPE